jgi:DNA repair protein RecN (Recombination protein N)
LQALGPEGAEGQMSDARRWLDAAAGKAEGVLDRALEALERAITELGEAAQGVERGLEALSFDPQDLERCEERLFAIRGLARKHAVAPDDLGTLAETLRGRLATLDGGASGVRALQAGVEAAGAAYALCATALSAARHKAAGQLDAAMAAELPPLKLEKATFCTDVGAAPAGPEGQDTVSFTVSTGPGLPAGPIDRIASGGELSRFLLALKVCLSGAGEPATLIFDEIDRGVGGATADAVGRRLARLAVGAQVLVVTHSPQVAARGRHHWRVEKQFADGVTLSGVTALAADDRIEEIARMLAGDQITDAARDAARALLAG